VASLTVLAFVGGVAGVLLVTLGASPWLLDSSIDTPLQILQQIGQGGNRYHLDAVVLPHVLHGRPRGVSALVSGFFKVFSQIDFFSGTGSFEGWIRRIMVNESLMLLRKRQPLHFPGDEVEFHDHPDSFSIESEISAREILEILDELPPGYRTIFNLYVLEGLKHHEIAELLGISINTSKSQLVLAKEKLRKILKTRGYV
jgi:RNA polymerase sigma-70 factor (ECF subfamily)